MLVYYFVIAFSAIVFVDAAQFKRKHLPNYIVPCSKSSPEFNDCATKHGKEAVPSLLKGDKEFKVPSLLPLHLPRVEVKSGNLELIMTDLDLYGLDKLEIKTVNINPSRKHASVKLVGDGLKISADYSIKGQILVLPISGNGKIDMKFDSNDIDYAIDWDLVKKNDGKEYASMTKSYITLNIGKAKFHLSNLFNGNKELGDNMNKVLNENSREVLSDLRGPISQVIEAVVNDIINSYLGSIPYDEILLP